MDLFTENDLKELLNVRNDHCISLYMPSFRTGADLQQNPIRFKNLIAETEKQLLDSGLRETIVTEILRPAKSLVLNGPFWQHPADALVAFIAPDFMKVFRLFASFTEQIIIGNHFHFKPLLNILTADTRYFVLDLDINSVRLFMCSRFMITRIQSDKIPAGIDETLGFDTQEKNVQFSSKPSVVGSNSTTVFGYGRQTDKRKVNILNYFHRVNEALKGIFRNSNAPLVLSGLEYLHSLYREANTYPYLTDSGILLNTHQFSLQEIHQKSWPIVENLFLKVQNRDAHYYQKLIADNNPIAVNDLKTIVEGAMFGRINTLFIADGTSRLWGKYNDTDQNIEIHSSEMPGDEDLLDTAALETMLKGGTVYIVEPENMPDSTIAAAILRY